MIEAAGLAKLFDGSPGSGPDPDETFVEPASETSLNLRRQQIDVSQDDDLLCATRPASPRPSKAIWSSGSSSVSASGIIFLPLERSERLPALAAEARRPALLAASRSAQPRVEAAPRACEPHAGWAASISPCPEIVVRRGPSKIGVAKRSLSRESRKRCAFGGDRLPDDPAVKVDRRLDMDGSVGLGLMRIEWRLRSKAAWVHWVAVGKGRSELDPIRGTTGRWI